MLKPEWQDALVRILRKELIRATGCTEPIAIAYCSAKVREVLGKVPERILAEVSGNILKNAKSVIVPNTGGMKGIKAAIAVGIVAGQADKGLEVISSVEPKEIPEVKKYLENAEIRVTCPQTEFLLDIKLTAWAGEDEAIVRIADEHSNIVYIEKNGKILLNKAVSAVSSEHENSHDWLNLKNILEFVNTVDLSLVKDLLDQQIACNLRIAEEGLKNNWGANIGKTLLAEESDGIKTEAKAWAAAGSDARMGGCELPVVIMAGSGNQGLATSVPVIRYALHIHAREEKLYRALLLSNLVTHYQKIGIGRLSAYCGAVSAGIGSGAGICYLLGGDYDAISHTITNGIAILSGTICDGAKPSCAAKIAAAVDAGIWGYQMYKNRQKFECGDGIVGHDVDETVADVGELAREGMVETDRTILHIMTK